MEHCENCERSKIRTPEEKKLLQNRLNRVIGQMNGVKKMIEEDRYCDDVLIQLAAVMSAVKSLAGVVLDRHMHTCVVENIKAGDLSVIDELAELFKRFA